MKAGILLAALLAGGSAMAQSTNGTGQDGAIQMQPLNALKPSQPAIPAPDQSQMPGDNGGFIPGTAGTGTGGAVAPVIVPGQTTTTTTTPDVAEASGAVVRWLDKVSGDTKDLDLQRGQSKTEGRLTVTLDDCRYPVGDPNSNAYAYLTIHDSMVQAPIFKGWMIASSPALNPLDSARYDVWVLHCTTS